VKIVSFWCSSSHILWTFFACVFVWRVGTSSWFLGARLQYMRIKHNLREKWVRPCRRGVGEEFREGDKQERKGARVTVRTVYKVCFFVDKRESVRECTWL